MDVIKSLEVRIEMYCTIIFNAYPLKSKC